jgi:hypothetical protein
VVVQQRNAHQTVAHQTFDGKNTLRIRISSFHGFTYPNQKNTTITILSDLTIIGDKVLSNSNFGFTRKEVLVIEIILHDEGL